MPELDSQIESVTRVIQLAITPVFLLSGIGALLAVLAGRLGRVIDRARQQEALIGEVERSRREAIYADLATLSRRANLTYRAIAMAVVAALLVCVVVIALFSATIAHVEVGTFIAIVFLFAMFALVGALTLFLREVFVATRTLRIGRHTGGRLSKNPPPVDA